MQILTLKSAKDAIRISNSLVAAEAPEPGPPGYVTSVFVSCMVTVVFEWRPTSCTSLLKEKLILSKQLLIKIYIETVFNLKAKKKDL